MIYLIGGPPKCGKTTLAKKLAKQLGIRWISSDTLEVIAMDYVWKYAPEKFDELYPHSAIKGKTNDETYALSPPKQIAKNYRKQAKASYAAVDMFAICEITDGNDCVIEGYHVTPELAARLAKKYGAEHFRSIFIVKENLEKFIQDLQKSTTPNDWILKKTKEKETFHKIAEMVSEYGKWFAKEAEKHGFEVMNMDENFETNLGKAIATISIVGLKNRKAGGRI
jgi:2-phosphoglycerate kinase